MQLIPHITYKGVSYQAAELVVFGFVVVIAIGAGVYSHKQSQAFESQKSRHHDSVEAERQAIKQIREVEGITEKKVADIQGLEKAVESRLLSGEQWDGFVKSLGDAWVFNAGQRTEDKTKTYVVLRGELTFLHQSVAEAQSVLDVLTKVEAMSPMLGVERLTIFTEGDATSRRFAAVKLAIAVPLKP